MILLCTTFVFRMLLGANYDWDTGVGAVMVNKRSVMKSSLTGRPTNWTSRFASITVNQYGRDFPTGGMNEAGVAVALMALDETRYPDVDERTSVGVLGWIQYQLDMSESIDEVIERSERVRIALGGKGVHYLVTDRTGRTATIEFLDGVLVAHHDGSLPVQVLANDTYDRSLAYFRSIRTVPNGIGSLERFARAATLISQSPANANAVSRAFTILDAVKQPNYTKWSVVYDSASLTVHVRTDRAPNVRTISFAEVDGSCNTAVRVADINDGEMLFSDYSSDANLVLVNTAYDQTPFLAGASAEDRRATAMHPETDVCFQPQRSRAVRR